MHYEGLKPGEEYEAVLSVYDKTDGKVIEEIEPVRQEFTASETGEGEVEVEVIVDGTKYAGHILVMYESVYVKPENPDTPDEPWEPDEPVTKHENPDDGDQTVVVPKIRTTAADDKTKDHVTFAEKKAKVIDMKLDSMRSPDNSIPIST